eukprot:1795504-Alexandrium_andersonii.AAC.1
MYNFFVRFSDRRTGESFRSMLDEQVQFVEDCVRESGNIALLERAATAITRLFLSARNRWSLMPTEDRLSVHNAATGLMMSHGRAELELAQKGEPAQAGVARVPAAPAVEQTPEKIEKILAKCREE